MNVFKYAAEYSRFHGCFTFRVHKEMIILDFVDYAWTPWFIPRFFEADKIQWTNHSPLVQAFKIFFKTEAPCSVFCKDDSWTTLLGNERIIFPMPDKNATLHLYATPYFVEYPSIVDEYMQSITRSAHEHFYPYKNCILYLDPFDIPKPGECYMSSKNISSKRPFYRLCFLSSESEDYVAQVVSEWKSRRNIHEMPFINRETVILPKCIPFESVRDSQYPENAIVRHGNIRKNRSIQHPDCLLQDILGSYHLTLGKPIKDVGLVLDWPLTVSYEGSINNDEEHPHAWVAMLAINGHSPKRIVRVKHPFEHFSEYEYVPPTATRWSTVNFVPNMLILPTDIVKVTIQRVVIGFVYQGTFFCFSDPIIEQFSQPKMYSNVQYLLSAMKPSVLKNDRNIRVLETFSFEVDEIGRRYVLHRVQVENVPFPGWCICEVDIGNNFDAFPRPFRLSYLVSEWTSFFKRHYFNRKNKTIVRTSTLKLALTLSRHNICFKIKIGDPIVSNRNNQQVVLQDQELQLILSEEETQFVNAARLAMPSEQSDEEIEEGSCIIM